MNCHVKVSRHTVLWYCNANLFNYRSEKEPHTTPLNKNLTFRTEINMLPLQLGVVFFLITHLISSQLITCVCLRPSFETDKLPFWRLLLAEALLVLCADRSLNMQWAAFVSACQCSCIAPHTPHPLLLPPSPPLLPPAAKTPNHLLCDRQLCDGFFPCNTKSGDGV